MLNPIQSTVACQNWPRWKSAHAAGFTAARRCLRFLVISLPVGPLLWCLKYKCTLSARECINDQETARRGHGNLRPSSADMTCSVHRCWTYFTHRPCMLHGVHSDRLAICCRGGGSCSSYTAGMWSGIFTSSWRGCEVLQ